MLFANKSALSVCLSLSASFAGPKKSRVSARVTITPKQRSRTNNMHNKMLVGGWHQM